MESAITQHVLLRGASARNIVKANRWLLSKHFHPPNPCQKIGQRAHLLNSWALPSVDKACLCNRLHPTLVQHYNSYPLEAYTCRPNQADPYLVDPLASDPLGIVPS